MYLDKFYGPAGKDARRRVLVALGWNRPDAAMLQWNNWRKMVAMHFRVLRSGDTIDQQDKALSAALQEREL